MNNNSESVWTKAFIALFIQGLWRDFEVLLMGGACACFLTVGVGRSRSFLPIEKYIFSEHCGALHFWKEIFKFFALGNQMHISCIPPGFVVSPRKQQFLFFFFFSPRIRLFFPLSPLPFVAPSSLERTISSKAWCPAISGGPWQRREKLIWSFFCYGLDLHFSP